MKLCKTNYKTRIVILLATAVSMTPVAWSATVGDMGQPDAITTQQVASSRTPHEIILEISNDQKAVGAMLGQDDAALKSSDSRAKGAPKMIPVFKEIEKDLEELATVSPQDKSKVESLHQQTQAMLSALGDSDATTQIQSMADSADPAQAVQGHSQQILVRWYQAPKTVSDQTPIVDDLEKLDRANVKSVPLTVMTFQLGRDAASKQLSDRMIAIVTDTMQNPAAASIKSQLAAMKAAADKIALAENKPLTISGQMPDGKPFSSADYKGKVVLVDFWATWCGPCREELPRVKKMYSDYHDKGLEVIGVSNDYNVDALKSFVVDQQMPWPELFDADAASNQKWNSITSAQGITAIPTMFLIDKKGIVRSVTARENMEDLIPKLLAEAN